MIEHLLCLFHPEVLIVYTLKYVTRCMEEAFFMSGCLVGDTIGQTQKNAQAQDPPSIEPLDQFAIQTLPTTSSENSIQHPSFQRKA